MLKENIPGHTSERTTSSISPLRPFILDEANERKSQEAMPALKSLASRQDPNLVPPHLWSPITPPTEKKAPL